ncbi:UNVERIFIED_CONTAM: hypothetical protein FKN15_034280 [Acipenser sinensis]
MRVKESFHRVKGLRVCFLGIGRWTNPEYVQFITILEETKKNNSPQNKGQSPGGVALLKPEPKHRGATDSVLNSVGKLPCQIISYLIANSFGRRMLYPGSVCLLQKAMMPMLNQGQARLVEECGGQRAKLVACDGNDIDTMFVDKRNSQGERGKKLVICCEGNAGFYEVGCVNTPLEVGYSVLGWNHPGFGGSTGVPFPQNEANAMDVVVQYAIHKLGFEMKDIVIYAWSIGGFTATWAAMSYPEVSALVLDASFDDLLPLALKVMPESWTTWAAMSYPEVSALVLDASFDDLLPLALKVMPESWRPLVTRTVRHYMNLNNAEQLCKYQGPVLLIRRTKDEIITTTGPEDIMSNRGNYLLLRLLQFRYPKVMTEEGVRAVREWLGASSAIEEASVYSRYEVDDDWCTSVLQSYQTDQTTEFPWTVGEDMTLEGRRQLALFLSVFVFFS